MNDVQQRQKTEWLRQFGWTEADLRINVVKLLEMIDFDLYHAGMPDELRPLFLRYYSMLDQSKKSLDQLREQFNRFMTGQPIELPTT